MTKHHRLGRQQQKGIFSRFQRLEAWDLGVSRVRVFWASVLGLPWPPPPCPHVAFRLCAHASVPSASLIKTARLDEGPPMWAPFILIPSLDTPSPNRVRTSTEEFWEVTVQPLAPFFILFEGGEWHEQAFILERALWWGWGGWTLGRQPRGREARGETMHCPTLGTFGSLVVLPKTQDLVTHCKCLPPPAGVYLSVWILGTTVPAVCPGWAWAPTTKTCQGLGTPRT